MSASSVTSPARSSLAAQAYEALRDRLIMLDIRPGSPLNESRLAQELGFGRTPVREALKRLEADHMVVTFPRRGTFATTVDITELAAVSEVRLVLEPLAARKAADDARPEIRAALRQMAEEIAALDPSSDRRTLLSYDLAVHRLIYRAAGNPHLETSLVRLDNLATRIWSMVLDRHLPIAGHITEHEALLDAVLSGDADRAAHLSAAHIVSFEATVRSVL